MAAALHGADFPKAKALRERLSTPELEAFATRVRASGGSETHMYNHRSRNNLKQHRGR